MKKIIVLLAILLSSGYLNLYSQKEPSTGVYLITCAPGTATYSIYGHSALRIVDTEKNSDLVYNWGVFDFSTPNFVWKFAKGRLDYMLGVYSFKRFIQEYFLDQRSVYQQKINLEPDEMGQLFMLLAENLKPENIKYRYDFFYDDCSTRIRDLLEKSLGNRLLYSPEATKKLPTFRDKVGEYLRPYPWLNLGVDLLMGIPGDKKANSRDRMFLPVDMMEVLSDASINRTGKMIPLLQNSESLLEFDPPAVKQKFFTSPLFTFSLLFILILTFFIIVKNKTAVKLLDIVLYTVFSVLAIMMIFFNFFTDHQQMRWNLNIIWLSPFIILCLASIILNRDWQVWFRIVFILSMIFFLLIMLLPHAFNSSFMPLSLILIFRSSVRAGFSWNPLSLNQVNEL
ncbi:MAG: DUF4105 domain-containing protein [Bacteroidales bacterium]|jgi:hypothetical protein|nr:DUF4105 domain-containing protein [Bacteroidales bacterium]